MASLYQRWRSKSFDDLLGQEHVVRTLRNAVRNNRIAHAYLFTGPRGTGKTSTARILARAVNCKNPIDGNPDNTCEACLAAQEGRALDVIEIDAASNTSVDNVRELRERVAYAAGEGQYKVYIVDEVHRLSGAAFDAFLKTLEEPPPHVIFVFASTEPHKVPATIASRCQRFDFRRIPVAVTLGRLQHVVREEGIKASEMSLLLIAQSANGSLRDALSLLDQLASYAEGEITEAHIRQSLGLADPLLVARLTDALLSGDPGTGLAAASEFFDAGGDPQQLLSQLVGYWRALLLATTGTNQPDDVLDPSLAESLQRHAKALNHERVLAVLRGLSDAAFSPKYDLVPALPFEVGYVQASLALTQGPSTPPKPVSKRAPLTTQPAAITGPPAVEPIVTTSELVAEPASFPPSSPTPSAGDVAHDRMSDLDTIWANVIARMRAKSSSAQAILRSGYLLKTTDEEVTIGFLHDFHTNYFTDVAKRKMLEQVVADVLGSAYRVQCIRSSREEVDALRGAGTVPDDDGFVEEVAEKLRQFHAKQISNGDSPA